MKIEFDAQGKDFIEIIQNENLEIEVRISCADPANPRKRTINTAYLSEEKFLDFLKNSLTSAQLQKLSS